MRFNFKKCILPALAMIFLSKSATSQISSFKDSILGQVNTITTAVPFLQIAPDSRAGGMGDYGVATSPDANSIHWNPSKLAFIEKSGGFSVSYTPWLRALVNDINLAYVSGYKKLNKDQTFAASLLYFSLGSIDFTDEAATKYYTFSPSEWAFDIAYARKLGESFSGGLALRYIYSNLTGGVTIQNGTVNTHAGTSVAADVSAYYQKEMDVSKKNSVLAFGLNISNIGTKISYTDTKTKDFIPTNFRLGSNLKMELDKYNTISFGFDINKLLVPTPPVYERDSTGNYAYDADGNKIILAGEDPTNISVPQALITSWSDAPGGFEEEMKEFTYSIATEYWYDKQFAIRAGYFHEAATKGNRQYFTIGAGLRYNVFGLDFAYLIPTTQRNPLENTLRFTLLFDFDASKSTDSDDTTE
ncbi:MAG TPA: type IX secretion system outer membrane channel protein PorV [Bacteroidia bacterium]|nr:type IX secretion system outer membrane channel protein PorV [Bacteroidota bacterium]MBK7431254.1 type IX secretion system outer membrane channel protein PorV [Bacteroidota bacterium]MBK7571369.1 type IX secretion system outer membrane channel protein PorV [Bacteroidota bacterium]MBK8585743.1 type IX secretion system outer membrane channel protein PorV [Bacteroidota bacterium]HQW23765.1 type IX secretion system outer membrane channel protein PorV [Bacteroidia bacterium]